MPADAGDFSWSVTSDRSVDVYIRKGTELLPDTVNFDSVVKADTQIGVNSQMFNMTKGAIFAVHCSGGEDDSTTFSVKLT